MLQPHEGASGTGPWYAAMYASGVLQPHEGASGTTRRAPKRSKRRRFNPTRVHLEPGLLAAPQGLRSGFNPTRVHLERGGSSGGSSGGGGLQPHEGASGTNDYVRSASKKHASTPRGCIWNAFMAWCARVGIEASTPRGCIWNLSGLHAASTN